jgi:hypothetical protein
MTPDGYLNNRVAPKLSAGGAAETSPARKRWDPCPNPSERCRRDTHTEAPGRRATTSSFARLDCGWQRARFERAEAV